MGERLAKMEIFIFLTHLLSRYTVKKPSDSSALSFEGRSGATYGPKPFEVCAEPVHIFKENVRLYNNIGNRFGIPAQFKNDAHLDV